MTGPIVHTIRPNHYRLNREMRLMNDQTVQDLYLLMAAINRPGPIWFFTYDTTPEITCCAPLLICG